PETALPRTCVGHRLPVSGAEEPGTAPSPPGAACPSRLRVSPSPPPGLSVPTSRSFSSYPHLCVPGERERSPQPSPPLSPGTAPQRVRSRPCSHSRRLPPACRGNLGVTHSWHSLLWYCPLGFHLKRNPSFIPSDGRGQKCSSHPQIFTSDSSENIEGTIFLSGPPPPNC
ncbi:hypothetical protein Nmel_012328, partial [Mimus melanotis]